MELRVEKVLESDTFIRKENKLVNGYIEIVGIDA